MLGNQEQVELQNMEIDDKEVWGMSLKKGGSLGCGKATSSHRLLTARSNKFTKDEF